MARWPSGKAEACKAFIPGSNPGLASSKLTTPASAGVSFCRARPCLLEFWIASLKSAKNLYFRHRFFCKIRQINRFFDVFRHNLQILCRSQARSNYVVTRTTDLKYMSLKNTSCLSKASQTWREKPANSSDMVRFSGKSFRLGEKIRLRESVCETNFEIGLRLEKSA